jgi:hypothetical protein
MKLKEEIATQTAADSRREPARYRGYDWFQLTDEEELVFAIDRSRFHAMVVAWSAYEAFLELADTGDFSPGALDAGRRLRPDLVKKGSDIAGFQHFCKEFTDLTFREAHAMYAKNQFWEIRTGTTNYVDEQGRGNADN